MRKPINLAWRGLEYAAAALLIYRVNVVLGGIAAAALAVLCIRLFELGGE